MTGQWICKLQIARPPPTYCATSPTCHTQSLNSNLQQFKQMSLKNWKFSHIYCSHESAWYTNTHTRLTALFPGLPRWAGTRKVKPIWILLKQKTVSGSGISWAICKSARRSRQTTTPAPHHLAAWYINTVAVNSTTPFCLSVCGRSLKHL